MSPILSATRLASLWERLRISFWFLPSWLAAAAFVLAFALVELDRWLGKESVREMGWLYTFGPEGARAVLSTIAGSMITVAGLTFSITMLTLQLASSQFGPRLLRDFMRDRSNQIVLGVFISTFLYCLLVLRAVRGTEGSSFTPHLAVFFGVALAVASLAVLIYFVHHVATSIRIETVLADLARQTREGIDRLYPATIGEGPIESAAPRQEAEQAPEEPMAALPSEECGYVQRIDDESLMRLASSHDLVVRIEARPGAVVAEGAPLLSWRGPSDMDDALRTKLRKTVILGEDRSPHQDLDLSLRRIVEIAQRALSPGVNDPTTAIYCLDRLEEALALLASRRQPARRRFDPAGRLRVIAPPHELAKLAPPAFAAVARYGLEDVDVVERLLSAIRVVAGQADPTEGRSLRALGVEIGGAGVDAARLPSDRDRIAKAIAVLG